MYTITHNEWFNNYEFIRMNVNKLHNINIVLLPHAGYKYSGKCINETCETLDFINIKKIIILSTSHKNNDNYYINGDYVKLGNKLFPFAHIHGLNLHRHNVDNEHSFDMMMPILEHYVNDKTTIIPIMIGNGHKLDDIINGVLREIKCDTLIMCNSDFVHAGKNYGNTMTDNDINTENNLAIKSLQDINYDIRLDNTTICGKYVLKCIIGIIRGLNLHTKMIIINKSSSLDHDSDIVDKYTEKQYMSYVTYYGIIWQFKYNLYMYIKSISLLPKICAYLIPYIKPISSEDFVNKLKNKFVDKNGNIYPNRYGSKKYGIFVTMNINNEIAGCIGAFYNDVINMQYTISELIAYYTFAAIMNDYRFTHTLRDMTSKEYETIFTDKFKFKITFLGETYKVAPEDFFKKYEYGRHGIVTTYNGNKATFLPSVMVENGWDPGNKLKFIRDISIAFANKMGINNYIFLESDIELYCGIEI